MTDFPVGGFCFETRSLYYEALAVLELTVGLELTETYLPLPPKCLGLKVCTTIPSLLYFLYDT